VRAAFTFLLVVGVLNLLALVTAHRAGLLGKTPPETEASSRKESCLSCHSGMTGFSASHHPEEIGCSACHLGDPGTTDKTLAHKGMVLIPGNLAEAALTCGSLACHPGIDARVTNSLMNTMSGIVGVNRFVFDEIDSPDGFHDIRDLGESAADTHLRNLCASCHLGQEKRETGPINELSRGGGCNACHLNHDRAARAAHEKYHRFEKKLPLEIHPSLSLQVTNDHCFGCHSRSGRISTNYEGWHETGLKPEDLAGKEDLRLLEDGRVFTCVQDDVHHARGLSCIDCHGSFEVMGSGRFAHEEDAVRTTCRDCHANRKPRTASYDQLDPESQKIVDLRNIDRGMRFVIGEKSDRPIINVFLNHRDQLVFLGKNNGREFELTAPGPACTRDGAHADLSCTACHSSWAPQCIGCHTSYDRNDEGYDLLNERVTRGAWIEEGSHFFAEFPALGVVENRGSKEFRPFIPGMVMTLDKSGFSGKPDDRLHPRLYAPTSPHTIAARGRGCSDCHNNPVALGYGRGELKFTRHGNTGEWSFEPRFPPWEPDGLPLDAWIAFPASGTGEDTPGEYTTRTNARPLNLSEQKKMLRVGACLTCHEKDPEIVQSMLTDFEKVLAGRSKQCLVPQLNISSLLKTGPASFPDQPEKSISSIRP